MKCVDFSTLTQSSALRILRKQTKRAKAPVISVTRAVAISSVVACVVAQERAVVPGAKGVGRALQKALRVPRRLGAERRRSSSVRPPSVADDKDARRRRRLSEMAGGVFYSDSTTLTRGHDNLALGLDSEKPPPDECNQHTSF